MLAVSMRCSELAGDAAAAAVAEALGDKDPQDHHIIMMNLFTAYCAGEIRFDGLTPVRMIEEWGPSKSTAPPYWPPGLLCQCSHCVGCGIPLNSGEPQTTGPKKQIRQSKKRMHISPSRWTKMF